MAPLDMKPNELEPYWVPFTANRAFKKRPRLFAGAKDMHYFKPDGTKVLDATSGLFCVNAGHCREPIVKAIQERPPSSTTRRPSSTAIPRCSSWPRGSRCWRRATSTTRSSPTRAARRSTPR